MPSAPDTKATTLFSLAALKIWLKSSGVSTSEDERMTIAADAASEEIENETSCLFVKRSKTLVVNGNGGYEFALPTAPVPSLTTLVIDGSALGSTEYVLDSDLGIITLLTRRFNPGIKNVSLTYVTGWDVQDGDLLPRDVYRAGLDLTKAIWDELTRNAISVSSISMGPVSTVIKSTKRPLSVQRVIDNWKSSRLA